MNSSQAAQIGSSSSSVNVNVVELMGGQQNQQNVSSVSGSSNSNKLPSHGSSAAHPEENSTNGAAHISAKSVEDSYNSESKRNEQQQREKDTDKEDSRFECNICLDTAKDAVVSMCGHLFCWPCLFQWMDTRPYRQLCPVCKSAISKEKVIPLYGRGGGDSDPREKIPPRPQGQRTEETNQGFPGMFQWGGDNGGHGGGVQFSLGIGVFPISFFASFFNTNFGGADRRPEARERTAHGRHPQFSQLKSFKFAIHNRHYFCFS
ncbi:hypothetical protein GPALN_005708 [Globodera pallida]|nr:hypothetical protein GPALN_005708 [Globodera pallida]